MDLSNIVGIFSQIMAGGARGIVAILMVIILGLLYDRKKMQKTIDEHAKTIKEMMADNLESQRLMTAAMNELRVVLAEMSGRLKA